MEEMLSNKELDNYLEQLRKDGIIKIIFFNCYAANIFLKRGFAKKENIQPNKVYDLVITDQGRSFIGFVKEQNNYEKEKRIEELNERAVISAESSAEAAQESATAANKANIVSIIAMVISIISVIISLLQILLI